MIQQVVLQSVQMEYIYIMQGMECSVQTGKLTVNKEVYRCDNILSGILGLQMGCNLNNDDPDRTL